MNITDLEVDGFGAWSSLRVAGVGGAANVIYGPNEAGKTTLLQFIRSMLYGFAPSRQQYLPPLHGGAWGGRLGVASPHGRFDVARHWIADAAADRREELILTAADGARHGEHYLKVLLAGIDEPTFNNVFAVGLREIQELNTLSDTEAAAKLYSLTVGLDRVALAEVMRELATSRNRVLDRGAGPSQVAQLVADRDRLLAEIEQLQAAGRRYTRIVADRDQLAAEINRCEEQSQRLANQVRLVEVTLGVHDVWQRRAAVDEELTVLGRQADLPEGAVERFDAVQAALQRRQQRLGELQRQQAELREQSAGLAVNESLARHAARIEALREQEGWLNNLQQQVAGLEREVADLEKQLGAERQRLGLDARNDAGRLPATARRGLESLRGQARAMHAARQRAAELQAAATEAHRAADAAQHELAARLQACGCKDLAGAVDDAGGSVAQLRRRVQIDERLEQSVRYQRDLEQQSRELLEKQLLPLWVLFALGGAFALGVMLLLAGIWLGTGTSGLGWLLALVGIGGSAAAAASKLMLERSNARQFQNVERQLTLLQEQVRQTQAERDALDKQLPRGGGPLAVRLQNAEKQLAALEDVAPLEARRNAARDEAAAADRRLAQAHGEHREARNRWRDGLRGLGLPGDLSPKRLQQLLRRSDDLAQWNRTLTHRREELAQRRLELQNLEGRIVQLAADAGAAVEGTPLEQLRQLADALERQVTVAARRAALRRQARKLTHAQRRHETAISRLRHRRRAVLLEAGVGGEQEFRDLVQRAARVSVLRREREELDRQLDAATAGVCARDVLDEQLRAASPAQLRERREHLAQRQAAVASELRARLEQRGRLAAELAALAADRQLGRKQLELAAVETRLQDTVHRWRVLATTCRALDDIRGSYERERQPETLCEASQYLQRLTQGRYTRVWTPLDESVLRVDDAEGRSLPVAVLSRGTREQLFLSLRLALAAWYARHGAPLPLVLDDVLVNYDAQRARAAAEVLCDFAAAGHQLLVFTCHEHIVAMFDALHTPRARLPEHAAGQPTTVRFEQSTAESRPTLEEPPRASDPPAAPRRRRSSPRMKPARSDELRIAVAEPPRELVAAASVEPPPAPVPAAPLPAAPLPPVPAMVLPAEAPVAPRIVPQVEPAAELPPPVRRPARPPRPKRGPQGVFDADYFESENELEDAEPDADPSASDRPNANLDDDAFEAELAKYEGDEPWVDDDEVTAPFDTDFGDDAEAA